MSLPTHVRWVSSAYILGSDHELDKRFGKSIMYRMNNRGPSIAPLGNSAFESASIRKGTVNKTFLSAIVIAFRWNRIVNVVVFQEPDVFTEFRRVPVFCMTKWRSVVFVSSFEGVFCESDVCFRSVIVVTFDGCLVDNWWLKAVSVKRACVLLSAVAWFVVNRVICGFISVFGWIQDTFVVVDDNISRSTLTYRALYCGKIVT